jgi:Fe-S oxidoreductase
MAKIKLEWQHRQNGIRGVRLRDRVLASIPRLAAAAGPLRRLANTAAIGPMKGLMGIAPERELPRWHPKPWRDEELPVTAAPDVVLFVDTFTRWFEPENARAAVRVLHAGGWSVATPKLSSGGRGPCCGRTYLSSGMLDEARREAERTLRAVVDHARRGAWLVGLEPSCLYTLRDEFPALLPGPDANTVSSHAMLLEDFLDRSWSEGRELPLAAPDAEATTQVLVHGHCHQKAFGGTDATLRMLGRIPGVDVSLVESSCCGMAGAFGYHREHYDVSMAMAELSLAPAVRAAPAGTLIVADGTSCRAQIADTAGREAVHAAVVLDAALAPGPRFS